MNKLTKSIFAVLLLASPLVGAETDYPAADFQPKVLYKDSDYKPSATKATETPKTEKASAATADDSQFPATNFQPKVLYKDDSYKPSPASASVASKERVSKSASESFTSSPEASAIETKSESKLNYLIVLAFAGIVGFVFLKNRSKCEAKSSAKAPEKAYKNAGGLTGVAKYLNKVSGTGVARYIDKQIKSSASASATGVAKYVAKQGLAAKSVEKNTSPATGVEKYMRNRK